MQYNFDYVFKNNHAPQSPILFLHGFAASNLSNHPFQQLITTHDYYGLNLPGHKQSNFLEPQPSFYEMVKFVLAFIKEKKLKNIILMGHSMGGGVCNVLIGQHPELFQKVIYMAPMGFNVYKHNDQELFNLFFPQTFEDYKNLFSLLYINSEKMLAKPAFLIALKNGYEKNKDNKVHQELFKTFHDPKLRQEVNYNYTHHKIPGLVILGKHDGLIEYNKAYEYYSKQPNLVVKTFENSSHLPMSEEPDKLLKIFEEFVNA